MNLPKHICLSIQHNPHRGDYETVEKWLELNDVRDAADITPEDRAAILATGEVWVISWCPDTPVGSCTVAASTLERALEKATGERSVVWMVEPLAVEREALRKAARDHLAAWEGIVGGDFVDGTGLAEHVLRFLGDANAAQPKAWAAATLERALEIANKP